MKGLLHWEQENFGPLQFSSQWRFKLALHANLRPLQPCSQHENCLAANKESLELDKPVSHDILYRKLGKTECLTG